MDKLIDITGELIQKGDTIVTVSPGAHNGKANLCLYRVISIEETTNQFKLELTQIEKGTKDQISRYGRIMVVKKGFSDSSKIYKVLN